MKVKNNFFPILLIFFKLMGNYRFILKIRQLRLSDDSIQIVHRKQRFTRALKTIYFSGYVIV